MRIAWLLLLVACGGAPPPATVADACYLWATTVCGRLNECGTLVGTMSKCTADNVAACCSGPLCAQPVAECKTAAKTCCADSKTPCTVGLSLAYVQGCDAAFRGLSCGQLAAGLRPAACN